MTCSRPALLPRGTWRRIRFLAVDLKLVARRVHGEFGFTGSPMLAVSIRLTHRVTIVNSPAMLSLFAAATVALLHLEFMREELRVAYTEYFHTFKSFRNPLLGHQGVDE